LLSLQGELLKNFAQKINNMRQRFFKREHTNTAFVKLDTKKCEACWKCVEVCSNNVIGKINLPWHKHILIVNESACIGCMKCAKICKTVAITKLNKA
jgi:NAD-dependent dihydropyrimidine dehydrogenase PreA subunit